MMKELLRRIAAAWHTVKNYIWSRSFEMVVERRRLRLAPKDLIIIKHTGDYPMRDDEAMRFLSEAQRIINQEGDASNRVLFVHEGFDVTQLSESHFMQLWRSVVGAERVRGFLEDDTKTVLDQLAADVEKYGPAAKSLFWTLHRLLSSLATIKRDMERQDITLDDVQSAALHTLNTYMAETGEILGIKVIENEA